MTAAPTEITVADIGGTHARFALARVQGGRVAQLGEAVTLKVADHGSLPLAWRAFAARMDRVPPKAAEASTPPELKAAAAIAAPLEDEEQDEDDDPEDSGEDARHHRI